MLTSVHGLIKAHCGYCDTFQHVNVFVRPSPLQGKTKAVCCEVCGLVVHWIE